jgi:hypothetical protein
LTACNVHSAAGAHDWNELVEAYFCDDDEGSRDSDEEFVGLDDESLPTDHADVNNNVLDLDENEPVGLPLATGTDLGVGMWQSPNSS